MINVGNDREVADVLHLEGGACLPRGKLLIIPVGGGMRAPYAPLRRPNVRGTPIRRRTTAPVPYGHSAHARQGRRPRRPRPRERRGPQAAWRAAPPFRRIARSRHANTAGTGTAPASRGGQIAAVRLDRMRDEFDGL